MKTLLCIVSLLIVFGSIIVHADNLSKAGPPHVMLSTSYQNHTARVTASYKPFDRKKHGIPEDKHSLSPKLLGTDGNVPDREIDNFTVELDGQKIPIPARWYADCYDPNFASHLFHVVLGEGLDSVMVFMDGSSGAGAYSVAWEFRKDGHHSRVDHNVSDGPSLFLNRTFLRRELQPDKTIHLGEVVRELMRP